MLELQAVVLKPGARPITHRFEAGQIAVVLGGNHSGKTLLTRVIAGLAAPLSGEIILDGECITRRGAGERSVSLVYQAFVNYPHWTVFENLASPLKARARRGEPARMEETARDVAARLSLTPLLARYPHELSGGQQQRLAIGRALARAADVLVMDEPLVNLDYKLRESLQLELRNLLHDSALCVIYTSSDPRDGFALADQIVLLGDHTVLQSGDPLGVYREPASPDAADLMSDPCANRWRENGATRLVRPEHLYLEPGGPDDVAFEVEVLGRETNGSETFLHCRLGDSEGAADHWVARLEGLVPARTGERRTLFAPADAVLTFAGTGH
jgi:glycerol transport system ATP-binding protein